MQEKDLFCRRYWHDAAEEGLLNQSRKTSVEMHGYLNSINHNFIIPGQPKLMDSVHWQTNMTPREMISMTDFEFKRLKPLEQKMHVYRAIGEKPEFFSEYKLYQKARDIQKGDVMMMREYAYATSDPSYQGFQEKATSGNMTKLFFRGVQGLNAPVLKRLRMLRMIISLLN